MIQRRLYLYIVAAVSLGMLLVGLGNLGTTTLNAVLRAPSTGTVVKDAIAGFGAVTLVGLPVWLLHWTIAQRLAGRHPDERASALRRLYLYLVLAATAVAAAIVLRGLLEDGLGLLLGSFTDGAALARTAWVSLLLLAFWFYHLRVAEADRAAVGQVGTSATLRRWYAYGLLFLGLAFLLFGARSVLQQVLVLLVDGRQTIVFGGLIPASLATMLTGLGLWGFHFRWTSREPLRSDDRGSTLRAAEGFLVLAGSVALTLVGASQLLYYMLARALGIQHPGGVSDNLLAALAGPGSTVVVFGLAWVWTRRGLAADAGATEAARQAGVRRLYTHLVALLALATLAVGAAGLLWTLSDQVLNSLLGRNVGEWRDRASLFLTLAVVGTPMWLTHWKASPEVRERFTLSRRLYLYAALLGSVLALLISGAILLYRVLGLILSTSDTTSGAAVVDAGRSASVILVAVALGLYHWRLLRADSAARPAPASEPAAPASRFTVAIDGANEDQIRRLLGGLPGGATYALEPRKN
ncbi:MAG: DUF5671 domain-containing protein [Candidatus Dormibacter sp.]